MTLRDVPRSIRFRITVVASAAVAVVLAGVGVALLAVQARQLSGDLDESLRRRADEVVASGIGAATRDVVVLPSAAGDEVVIQIVTGERVMAATDNAVGIEPIAPAPSDGNEAFTTVRSLPVEDDRYRILSRSTVIDGVAVEVHVAENTDDLEEVLGRLRTTVLLLVPAAVLVLGGLVWWLVGRTLRPVERIRADVAGFGPSELTHRVAVPGTGDEIDRLAGTMNAMLDRLQDATQRQQRFVADASHELRSPLARMRTEIDTAVADASDDQVDAATLRSVSHEIDELTALVDDLLVLARYDAGRSGRQWRPVDLDDLVFDEVRACRQSTDDVAIDVTGVSAAQVLGDPGELRRVVRNLLDNGVHHATSLVEVTLEERSEAGLEIAVLTVVDDGSGIPEDAADSVFERFTRLDDARTRRTGGTGLGLAIAREITERHGGTIGLTAVDGRGARFVVRLPAQVTPS